MSTEETKSNIGIAKFECESGNTLDITFPEVIEKGPFMNIGVALMPTMVNEGYYFLSESINPPPSSPPGLNDVETDFVEYLYKIRQANRDNKILDYSIFTGPRRLKLRERVFIAGKIYPVLSISYNGNDIDCSTAKFETRSINFRELRLLFGETFGEYKQFSTQYISIDNDNIRIYLPKNSEMNIDYKGLLIDLLCNGEKTMSAASNGEFHDMDEYKLVTGKTKLSDGSWLTKDRDAKNDTWKNACMHIIEKKLQGVQAPFSQIGDFYTMLDDKITNETEHKTRWLKGAKKLVNALGILDGGLRL